MARLRISVVKYLNTAPLVWGFTDGPLAGRYDLSFTEPSQCAEELRSGAADVAIIPAIEYQRMEGVVALPQMAVASKNAVRSLLLLSRKPIERARRVALDRSSRSTQALVRILCAEHWRIAPEFIEAAPDPEAMLLEADAALLIGDPALRLAIALDAPELKAPLVAGVDTLFVYDVVEQWRQMTGLPGVMAIWVARKEAATPEVVADFLASKEYGLGRIGEIASGAAAKLSLPPRALERYLRENIDFSLDEENRRGLMLYFQKCAELGLIPRARPLEFAPVAAGARAAE